MKELEELRPAWDALWEGCPWVTPFQSPEWLIPWWETFAPGSLCLHVLRRGGNLSGLAPLYRDESGLIRLIGAGNTDYLDVLAEPEAGVGWLFEQLREPAELQDVPQDSPLIAAAELSSSASFPVRIERAEPCPTLDLPSSFAEWRCRLPHGLKRNLRRYREKLGDVEFITTGDPACLPHLFRLHSARWRELRGEAGVLAEERLRRFHRSVAEGFARRGWLRLWMLSARGMLAAVVYGFVCRRRAYFYIGGFEPELARFGPGTLAVGHAIESAIAEGVASIHFLRGAEPYKYAWGARDCWNRRILFGSA